MNKASVREIPEGVGEQGGQSMMRSRGRQEQKAATTAAQQTIEACIMESDRSNVEKHRARGEGGGERKRFAKEGGGDGSCGGSRARGEQGGGGDERSCPVGGAATTQAREASGE
jgi:hypothetical protein